VKPGTNNAAEKRKKELLRQQWQREKAERRQQRQLERQARGSQNPEEDPDLAGIVPGPQPTQSIPGDVAPGHPPDPAREATAPELEPNGMAQGK